MEEQWRKVVGFEDYEVSTLGNVRSLNYARNKGLVRNRITHVGGAGYMYVTLSKKGKTKRCAVHCLVAYAFLGERPQGYEINHKDGIKKNCSLDNLEYCTKSDNAKHAWRIGLQKKKEKKEKQCFVGPSNRLNIYAIAKEQKIFGGKKQKGSKNFQAKLTEDDVDNIRAYLEQGCRGVDIARMFNVSGPTISSIKNGSRWS